MPQFTKACPASKIVRTLVTNLHETKRVTVLLKNNKLTDVSQGDIFWLQFFIARLPNEMNKKFRLKMDIMTSLMVINNSRFERIVS